MLDKRLSDKRFCVMKKKLGGHCSRLEYGWILGSSSRLQKLNYLFMCQVIMVYLQRHSRLYEDSIKDMIIWVNILTEPNYIQGQMIS